MEQPASIMNRLALRRAGIAQLSGVEPHALDDLVTARGQEIRQRGDARIAALEQQLDELTQPPDADADA